jgi:hypothetical protein
MQSAYDNYIKGGWTKYAARVLMFYSAMQGDCKEVAKYLFKSNGDMNDTLCQALFLSGVVYGRRSQFFELFSEGVQNRVYSYAIYNW